MQFLHTVHCVIFDNFYNKRWNWYLFCLFSLLFKNDDASAMLDTRTETTIFELLHGQVKEINIKPAYYFFKTWLILTIFTQTY